MALEATKQRQMTLFSCATLKPFPKTEIEKILVSFDHIVVLEEHVPHGGLASRVKETLLDMIPEHFTEPPRLDCFTLKDEFVHCNGKRDEMLAAHGLTVEAILEKIK